MIKYLSVFVALFMFFGPVGAYEAGLTSTNFAETEAEVAQLTIEQYYDSRLLALLEETQIKFPLFYNTCIVPGFEGGVMLFTEDTNGSSTLNLMACEGKYRKEFRALNAFFAAINTNSEDNIESEEDLLYTRDEAQDGIDFYSSKIERIDSIWSTINREFQSTPTVEIILSSLSFIMELESLSLETYLVILDMEESGE